MYGNRGKRPVKSKNNTGTRTNLALSDDEKDKEKLKHQRGRRGYAEIAKQEGKYEEIADSLKVFIQKSPFYSQRELMTYLMSEFPTVFGSYKSTKYPQNFYKNIIKEELWFSSLKITEKMTRRAILNAYYKRAVEGRREEIDHNGNIYEVGMPDRDAVNFMRFMHEANEWDDEDGTEKYLKQLKIKELENKNKLLEAQIEKLKGNDNDDAYIKGFIADLDQIEEE